MSIFHKILSKNNIFKNKFLRNIILASLGLVTILPLFVILYILPSFTKLLVESTKDDAARVARHFASKFITEKEVLTKTSFKKLSSKEIVTLKTNFELAKLKVFSESGEAIFSTDPEDIGKVHKNRHIRAAIKNREVYAEIVHEGTETSEGQKMVTDVVETYVPLLYNGRLLGIFEVYYDISARKKQLDNLLVKSVFLLFTLAFGLLILVIVISFKENKSMTARKRAEDALHESEIRFRTIFRTSPDAITISRLEDGLIINVNDGFTSLSGYSKEDVLGISVLHIGLWNDPMDRERMVSKLQKKGQLDNLEAKFNHKNGQVLEALVSAKVIMLNQEPHILSVARDISELKKNEKTLKASQKFLQISNKHNDINSLLNDFIPEIKKLTNCSAIGMRILNGEGYIPYDAYIGFDQKFFESESRLSDLAENCTCMRVIRQEIDPNPQFYSAGGSFWTGSTTSFVATFSAEEKKKNLNVCNAFGYESVALIPIRQADKILGLIHVADHQKNIFPYEMVEVIEGAAMQLGTAIERVRAEQALQESHRELEHRVKERTANLISATELLKIENKERKYIEKKLLEQLDKMRSLSSELLQTEERERRRIATELHDRIGQTLAVIKIKLGELQETKSLSSAAEALNELRQFIDQTIEDTRTLTFELSPPVLYELGLEAALAWLAKIIQEKHHIQINVNDDGQSKPLDDSCRIVLFQATRELLFNVVKHARAQSAEVSIQKDDNSIRIKVEDDGMGFDAEELKSSEPNSRGFGLFSIRERLSPLGGELEIKSEPGTGSCFSVTLPLGCKIQIKGK